MTGPLVLPLDRGLDRGTGLVEVDQSSALDLREFLPREGKLQLRPPLGSAISTISGITHICHSEYFEAKGVVVYVVYDSASRAVKVYTTDLNGTSVVSIGTWGTLTAGAVEPPRFSAAESYSYMLLAHDEPTVTRRLTTQVFDGATIANLTANLDATSAKAYIARGVVEHLGYVWSWGFGSDSDKSRPEALRCHRPSDPRTIDTNVAWTVGARDQAILSCRPCLAGLLIMKPGRSYLLEGVDYRSFGVSPADRNAGAITMRAATTWGDYVYSWTADGPRRTANGIFQPLELPLELRAKLPVGLPTSVPLAYAHVMAWPTEEMLLWAFPDPTNDETLVFALSTRGNLLRWSYWHLPVAVMTGLTVRPTSESAVVAPGYPTATVHAGIQQATTYRTRLTFTLNQVVGDETVEVWGRQGANPYAVLTSFPISTAAATMTRDITVSASGSWDLAVRFLRGGVPLSTFTGDPSTWPAGALDTGAVEALAALTLTSFAFTPASTIAAGTWAAGWSGLATDAAAVLSMSVLDDGPHVSAYGTQGYLLGSASSESPITNQPAINVASVSSRAVTGVHALVSTLSGRTCVLSAIQTKTLGNGLVGSSTISNKLSAFFGLDESPGTQPYPPNGTSQNYGVKQYSVSAGPGGTYVQALWRTSTSWAAATAATTEVVALYRAASTYVSSTTELIVETPPGSGGPYDKNTTQNADASGGIASCDVRGVGVTIERLTYVRHLITSGGTMKYTRWRGLGAPSPTGTCAL